MSAEKVRREMRSAAKDVYSLRQGDEAALHEVNAVGCGLIEQKQTGEWALLIKIDGVHFVFRHDDALLKGFAEEMFTSVMRLEELRKYAAST